MAASNVEEIMKQIYNRRRREDFRPKTAPEASMGRKGERYLPVPKPAPPKLQPMIEQEEGDQTGKGHAEEETAWGENDDPHWNEEDETT